MHPTITVSSHRSERIGAEDYNVTGELQIRGIKKEVEIYFHYLGKWKTEYWKEDGTSGLVTRVGFNGSITLNRHDFQVDWNSEMENSGVVASHEIEITIDVEGLHQGDMQKLGI